MAASPHLRGAAVAASTTPVTPDPRETLASTKGGHRGAETGKGRKTERGIGIVITTGTTGIVTETGRGAKEACTVETDPMTGTVIAAGIMIFIVAGIMIGTGIMAEREMGDMGIGLDLDQRVDLVIDRGLILAPDQRANVSAVLIWRRLHLPCYQVLLFQAVLCHLSHCAANGQELTTVALIYKEELVHRFDGSCSSSTGNNLLFGQIAGVSTPFPVLPNMFAPATGQFPLPMMPQAMTQQATRHARRVYVGGLSPSANEQSVATFFSQVMFAIGGNTAGPGDAVVNVYINHEKKFAFVEMRSVEEASNAMALDGIIFEGAPVKVRRPSDYNPALAGTLGPSQPSPGLNLAAVGLTPGSAGGLEGPDRIFVGGLPYYFTESQVRELLESFGPLQGFDLVKDRETGNSKGYAFCVYKDLSVTDIACAALNGIKMGDKTLTVRRANQGVVQPRPEQESILLHAQQQVAMQKLVLQIGSLPTKVVCLTEVVNADELKDDEEYEDIMEDIRGEGEKYGKLASIVIPRPSPNGEPCPGVGKVFLEYADVEGSSKARMGLNGRKFGGNEVVAVFYQEAKFALGEYDG